MRAFQLLCVLTLLSLSACAPLQSVKSDQISSPPGGVGLVYHLPLKMIKLIVTVSPDRTTLTPDVEVSDSYPDKDFTYFLTATHSQFGNTQLDIGVNERGLLTSTKSTSTSDVDQVLEAMAGTAASGAAHNRATFENLQILPPVYDKSDLPCKTAGIFSRYVNVKDDGPWHLCRVTFTKVWSTWTSPPTSPTRSKQWPLSGVYYRQLRPVNIKAQLEAADGSALGEQLAFVVFVPDPDQVNSLAVPRNLFADNVTEMAFTDGVPTKYSPQVNSEVLGLFKIPADVIRAYFAAFGSVFTAFGSAKSAQAAAITKDAALQVEQYKMQLCLKALASSNPNSISTLCPSSY